MNQIVEKVNMFGKYLGKAYGIQLYFGVFKFFKL